MLIFGLLILRVFVGAQNTIAVEVSLTRRPGFANEIRRRSAGRLSDKWHLDEIVVSIAGRKCWFWRAVDHEGFVVDVLVQSRRNAKAARRLMRKLLKAQGRTPRVMITDKLRSYDAAKRQVMLTVEHRSHKGLTIGQKTRTNRSDDGRGS